MKFNVKSSVTNKTTNYEGGSAFVESPKLHFVSLLLTSFVSEQYYRSTSESLEELRNLIDAIPDKKFVAKAAIYARTKFGMRSISHAVAGEIAKRVKGEQWTKSFFEKIIYRPDDMTEILAYYYTVNGKKNEPNALRKGFAKALEKYDEYALGKYKKEGADVSLIDVINLVHPKSTPAIEKLIKGTLKAPKTWEVKLSESGQKAETEEEKGELKKEAWKELIKERKIGYFALLRNLRNILEQAPDLIEDATKLLTEEKLIKLSLVLPFRFLTAINEVQKLSGTNVRDVLVALNKAVDISTSNVPRFSGNTLVAVDGSGSMEGRPADIASLFGAVLYKSNNADLMIFSNDAEYITLNPTDSVLSLTKEIRSKMPEGGTDFYAIFQKANRKYDRIIILSDMQGWEQGGEPSQPFAEYKTRLGANPKVYSLDLQGYGSLMFPEKNVYCIAGFSEKILDVIKLLEEDHEALIHEIEKIEL